MTPVATVPRPADPIAGVPLTTAARRAQRIAHELHGEAPPSHEGATLEHVLRVALAVPPSARSVAFVHDAGSGPGVTPRGVAALLGLDEDEREALELLARRGAEPPLRQARRVARAPRGPGRELALLVLGAELEDRAAHDPEGPAAYDAARAVVADAHGAFPGAA